MITIRKPSGDDNSIQCSLWTAELIAEPGVGVAETSQILTYEALSYFWGNSTATKPIICNGLVVSVSENLRSAFTDLRREQEDIHIWCDALCINQSDPVERAQQVRYILRIFEKAEHVIAWIGLPDRRARSLFRALRNDRDGNQNFALCPHRAMAAGVRHEKQCLENFLNIVKAAHEHQQRPWFQRTWVRQEVFGTSELAIYCGGNMIGLPELITAIRLFEQSPIALYWSKGLTSLVVASVAVLETTYQHAGTDRHDYEPPRHRLRYSFHWLRVLNDGAEFEVTDPRDKVYGVLGIITSPTTKLYVESRPDIQRAVFPISYTKSVSEVYQEVVKHWINLDRNLDILQVFEDRRHREKDLPSWVTDWRQNIRRSMIQCSPDSRSERDRIGQAPIQDLNDIGKLSLKGVQVSSPLQQITAVKQWTSELYSPEPGRMDSNYTKMMLSNCFVRGRFLLEKEAITGKLPHLSQSEGLSWCHVLVPRAAKLDDILVALLGSSILFLLRPRPHDEYKFIGPVIRGHDRLPDWSSVEMRTFVLV